MPPFDPNLPPSNVQVRAEELRGQFNGLKEIIDAMSAITQAQDDGVVTLEPNHPACAQVSVAGNMLHFTFSIPRGQPGAQGGQGFQGTPGEVTNAALTAALALKAQNPSAVNTIPTGVSANYDQTQQQEIIDKLNELINALK